MEYVYGTAEIDGVMRENLKVIGGPKLEEGEYLTTVREYDDNTITDRCRIDRHYLTAEDEDAIATAAAVPRQLVIVNKTDLPAGVEPAALVQRFGQVYPLSAATGEGVDALCRAVEALYPAGKQAQGELLTNARQADAVARSLEAVRSARRALEDGMTPDAVLNDAEAALEALGELNGKRIREDLVQTIFSRFCVGK